MSGRALRVCSEPGCATRVEKGRCARHALAERQRPTQMARAKRSRKDPEQERFYSGSAWQKMRAAVKALQPVCRMCARAPSTEVDHIDGNWRNCALENLQALCHACHATKTAREHRSRVGAPRRGGA